MSDYNDWEDSLLDDEPVNEIQEDSYEE